ncbi:HNH endonuclease, partial [Granulosicoccus sp.]
SFIAQETAKRIACDCSISTITKTNGEPTDIGRKSRLWTNAMTRAIKERDKHCQFYGCTHTHNLQIHHIVHWANGGSTSVENGVSVCAYHHALLHEGGYSIQAVANNETSVNEQFSQQQHVGDTSMFNFEKELRNDKESFSKVRKLSPTTYRFRVFDADGRDISVRHHAETGETDIPTKRDSQIRQNLLKPTHNYGLGPSHSTRMECAEPKPGYFPFRKMGNSYGGGHGRTHIHTFQISTTDTPHSHKR